MTTQFVGAGWAFPVRTDPTGGIALVVREREVEEAIRIVLGTAPGERPMRPEFGCRIHDLVFGPANAGTAGEIAYEVRAALERWEPRIDVVDVRVGFGSASPGAAGAPRGGGDDGVVYVDLHYALRGSNDPRNLVFPFYVIPDHVDPGRAVPTDREPERALWAPAVPSAAPRPSPDRVPVSAGGR